MSTDSWKRSPDGMLEDFKLRIELLERDSALGMAPRVGPLGQEVSDWNDAIDVGFYWATQTAANRPPTGSWASAVVYRNHMEGFERIIQDAVKPTTTVNEQGVQWRRVGYKDGFGNWVFGIWEIISGARGSTANRTTYYGTPTTDAQRVALANRKIRYLNTDFGWEESYYAVTGLSGLTAPGLEAGIASGWYPINEGPKIVLNPGGAVVATNGTNLGGWSNTTWHRGGTDFLEYEGDGVVRVKLSGRYHIHWRSATQTGNGELDFWFYVGSTFANDAWELNATRFKTHEFTYGDVRVTANDTVRAYVNAGVANVHMSSSTQFGEFLVEYLGPRLVSA